MIIRNLAEMYYILAKTLLTLLGPENLVEKELKSIGLISLTEEIEDNLTFKLGHSYCSLFLFKFTA